MNEICEKLTMKSADYMALTTFHDSSVTSVWKQLVLNGLTIVNFKLVRFLQNEVRVFCEMHEIYILKPNTTLEIPEGFSSPDNKFEFSLQTGYTSQFAKSSLGLGRLDE
jgi:hypothetical protein